MVEIRFHGRGGQGTVVASKILADAIAKEGNYVQAYPEFGVERRGSPGRRLHPHRRQADLRQEPHLRARTTSSSSTRPSSRPSTSPRASRTGGTDHHQQRQPARGLPASRPSSRSGRSTPRRSPSGNKLGTLAAPIVNTAIVGAVIKILGLTKLESLTAAIRDGIPIKPEDNVKAAEEAYEKA